MKRSTLIFGRGTFMQKALAGFAILAVLSLSGPMQALAVAPVAPSYSITGGTSLNGLSVTVSGMASATNPPQNGLNHYISVNWDYLGTLGTTTSWQTFMNLTPDSHGNIPATAYSVQHTYPAAGTYTIKVLIHHANVNGNESSSFVTSVTVAGPSDNPPPPPPPGGGDDHNTPPNDPPGKCTVTGDSTSKTFSLADDPLNGHLTVDASGPYTLTVNGHVVESDSTKTQVEIPGEDLMQGDNTISFSPDSLTLSYSLEVHGSTCGGDNPPPPPPPDEQSCKLVSDNVDTYVGSDPASLVTPNPAWSSELNSDGAKWIWSAPAVTDPSNDQTSIFTRSFNVSGSPGTATLKIAADNSYSVKVNGSSVAACDGSGDSNFGSVDTCTIPVHSGVNTLEFTVTNEGVSGSTSDSNPAGLYYEVNVANASCTDVPPAPQQHTSSVTMCKVSDAEGHPGLSGWQLYLKGNLFNRITVGSASMGGVNSSWLTNGMQYLVTAMGTWNNQGGANPADAEYSTTDSWATHMDGYTGYGPGILELEVNNADTNWGPYNSAHTYSQIITGTGAQVHFGVFDGDTGTHTQNPSWYGDNSGILSVDINDAYAGTTGQDGCVTLSNVPYGTYTAGEIAQDGWTLTGITGAQGSSVDGNSVVVDSPTEHFTFTNHHEGSQEEPQSCVIVSDTTTLEGGSPSFIASFIHSAWTAVIDGASWIWGDAAITDPVNAQTQTFTKTFTLASAPTSAATLQIASDNSYSVKVNGTSAGSDSGEFNYTAAGQDSISIPASDFHSGVNTLEITVTNFAQAGGTQESNPAGLKYKLSIDGTSCTQDQTPPPPSSVKVHIYKYLWDGQTYSQIQDGTSGLPTFTMLATWKADNLNGGATTSANYNFGTGLGGAEFQYAAVTSPMDSGANYVTQEVTNGDSSVVGSRAECSPGKYYLAGYQSGTSLDAAKSAATTSSPVSFYGITSDKYVIVNNAACPSSDQNGGNEGGTLTIVKDTTGGDGTFNFSVVGGAEENTPVHVTTAGGVGTSTTLQLASSTYSVTENATDGWTYNSVSCSYDGESIGNSIANGELISLGNGDHVTCTFHNTKNTVVTTTDGTPGTGGGGGGHGHHRHGGSVLGVSTTTEPEGQVLGATCSPILTSYLGLGKPNPKDQVIVLQNFLNGEMGANLPVTGFFGPLTFRAVKDFQKKYFSDVLTPWVPFGLPSDRTPTGYVYKTTKWMINHIACAEADGPKPQLP